MAHAKVFHHKSNTFVSLLDPFNKLLDQIKSEATKGSKEGASAYAKASSGVAKLDDKNQPVKDDKGQVVKTTKGASDYVKDIVNKLSTEQLDWAWKGLELSSAADKHAQDVVNSVTSAWDKAASKYMKNDAAGGDSERGNIEPRLKEFDTAVSSKGGTPVKKDE